MGQVQDLREDTESLKSELHTLAEGTATLTAAAERRSFQLKELRSELATEATARREAAEALREVIPPSGQGLSGTAEGLGRESTSVARLSSTAPRVD